MLTQTSYFFNIYLSFRKFAARPSASHVYPSHAYPERCLA
jgi:hypothetical protein